MMVILLVVGLAKPANPAGPGRSNGEAVKNHRGDAEVAEERSE